jgi:hypothetical protein
MTQKYLLSILFYLAGTIILMIPALSNNYPFVYSDTGTYLLSGFENWVPKDRPIFYGWFIRHLSLSISLWIPVFVQSFLTFFLIHTTVKHFVKVDWIRAASILISFILISCTGVGLFTGKLMPDIFTGLFILAGFLLFFCKDLSRFEKILVSLIFYYGLLVHLSNIMVILLFVIFYLVYKLFSIKFNLIELVATLKIRILFFSMVFLATITVPMVNVIYYDKFEFSSGSHIFMMGRMGESGILKRYLDSNCDEGKYRLCEFKDEIPAAATQFIWPENSIFYKTGGWDSTKVEYNEILWNIYSTPKYWKWLIADFSKSTLKQFFTFSPGGIAPHLKHTPPYYVISLKMPHELGEYIISKQNMDTFSIVDIERRQVWVVYISLALLLGLLFTMNDFKEINSFGNKGILFFLAFMLLNAFVCGAMANVLDRLQGRVIWILPLLAIIIILNYFKGLNFLQYRRPNERI